MTQKELDEEIEYAYRNRSNEILILGRFNEMQKVICHASNSYMNLSAFMNDYIGLYRDKLIDRKCYVSAINDLYLIALLHTVPDDEDTDNVTDNIDADDEQ